ncbi:MAG: hypothetical protein WC600_15535 [Desulfobaccales bacterium]
MGSGKIIRALFSVALLLIGIALLSFSFWIKEEVTNKIITFLGSASIVTGVLSLFRELCILKRETEDIGNEIAAKVIDKLPGTKPDPPGMRLITRDRLSNYDIYNDWVLSNEPQEINCFGRSVLHRIDHNLRQDFGDSAEETIAKRLSEGCKIRIIFLDPQTEYVKLIAKEEGKEYEAMIDYIAKTIGICKRLFEIIKEVEFDSKAQLRIRVSHEAPYFSYHKVNENAIIGFYISDSAISYSPAYEVIGKNEAQVFELHFNKIFQDSTPLLELVGHDGPAKFNMPLYNKLYEFLCLTFDKDKLDAIIKGIN